MPSLPDPAPPPLRAGHRVSRLGRELLDQLRRVRTEQALRASATVAAVVLLLVEAAIASTAHEIAVPLAFVLAFVHTGSLPLATRLPSTAALLGLAAALGLQASSAATAAIWPWWPVLIVTQTLLLAVVAARTRLHVPLLHWVLALGASAVLAARLRPEDDAAAVDLVVFGSVSAGVIVVALLLAQWRRVRSELLHERRIAAAEAERRLVIEERTRIARELHDVVAHSLSIITVQTSTARFRHRDLGDAAIEELDRIGVQSRQALDEMRGLLRVLRGTGDEADLRPQPGLADLPDLVATAEDAGSRITLDVGGDGWAADVGPVTGLAAYRIAQEAVSNALRHAPGSAVHVELSRTPGGLLLSVLNSVGAATRTPAGRPGHGLIGMAERASSVGGRVRFGPDGSGGWAVRAVLPLTAASA